jgi:predicted DNA-binding transcriptional regulator AlpA
MRADLEAALKAAQTLPAEELPELIGELEQIRATALLRFASPNSSLAEDVLLNVAQAAHMLSMSQSYLYRHHARFAFTRRIGRALLFSKQGIQMYIRKKELSKSYVPHV